MRVAIFNTYQPEVLQDLLIRITLHIDSHCFTLLHIASHCFTIFTIVMIFMIFSWSLCDQLLCEHWFRLAQGELGRRVGNSGGFSSRSVGWFGWPSRIFFPVQQICKQIQTNTSWAKLGASSWTLLNSEAVGLELRSPHRIRGSAQWSLLMAKWLDKASTSDAGQLSCTFPAQNP